MSAEGKIYDETGENVKPHIEAFIKSYELPMDELLVKDLDQYPVSETFCSYLSMRPLTRTQTFNSFFSRRLLPTARPITSPEDPTVITSPADCRMTVFNTVDQAKQFWYVSGKSFDLTLKPTQDQREAIHHSHPPRRNRYEGRHL